MIMTLEGLHKFHSFGQGTLFVVLVDLEIGDEP